VLGANLGIQVGPGGTSTVAGNLIETPAVAGSGDGISVQQASVGPVTSATISRNAVVGNFLSGVRAEDTTGPVALDSNLITGALIGVTAQDDVPTGPGEGDVAMTNMTFSGNSNFSFDATLRSIFRPGATATYSFDASASYNAIRISTQQRQVIDGSASFDIAGSSNMPGWSGFANVAICCSL